jgi:hypothetical protein
MKNFKKIGRIYEMQDTMNNYPPELLSMTVGDLLDKMESMDSMSSTDYESLGTLLTKVTGDVLAGTGYVAPASDVPTGTAMEPTVDGEMPAEEPADDLGGEEDFAAAEPAAGGDEEMGRAKRESIDRSKSKKK